MHMDVPKREQIYLSESIFVVDGERRCHALFPCGVFEAFAAERPDEKAKISKGLTLQSKWSGNPGGTGQPVIVVSWAKKSALYNPNFFCK